MNIGQNLLVELSQSAAALLISQRQHDGETIDSIILRHFKRGNDSGELRKRQEAQRTRAEHVPAEQPRTYKGEVLGRPIRAETLSAFFAEVVDTIDEVAPETLRSLAEMRARTRAYVSRTSASVHAGRTDLPTRKTSSGWYVSENIGRKDLIRALKALCCVAGLSYGRDIRFT
jgi:hypothetical protein